MNLQTLKINFTDSNESQILQASASDIGQVLGDLTNYGINNMLKGSRYFRRSGLSLLPDNPGKIATYSIASTNPAAEQAKSAAQPMFATKAKPSLPATIPSMVRQAVNREHEKAFIILNSHTTVTCAETGISYSVALPCPERLNLAVVHPLSFFSNVHELLAAYARNGLRIESELEQQVLAGMLLTIWKHKKLLVCRDYVQANICLQRAKKDTLATAVRFFHSLPSAQFLPQIHIIPEALYDFYNAPISMTKEQVIADRVELLILNFMKVCRGEGIHESNSQYILKTKQAKTEARIRVYKGGGNAAIEARQVAAREKLGQELLNKIEKEFAGRISEEILSGWEVKLDALMFLGDEQRKQIANQILGLCKDSKAGKALAEIFATTKTETIELGLLSFSQEMEKEVNEFKQEKSKNALLNSIRAKMNLNKGN